jgi:hypothetical protein
MATPPLAYSRLDGDRAAAYLKDEPAMAVAPLNCLLGSLNLLSELDVACMKSNLIF